MNAQTQFFQSDSALSPGVSHLKIEALKKREFFARQRLEKRLASKEIMPPMRPA
jgi:hypothetical protein